jgi:hypothetical protein
MEGPKPGVVRAATKSENCAARRSSQVKGSFDSAPSGRCAQDDNIKWFMAVPEAGVPGTHLSQLVGLSRVIRPVKSPNDVTISDDWVFTLSS